MNKLIAFINGIEKKQINTPADRKQIVDAQTKLNVLFSDDYIQYLLSFGSLSLEDHEITGVIDAKRLNVVTVTDRIKSYSENIPDDWYVIEDLHIDGVVIWQDSKGFVFQTVPGLEPEKIANNLLDYLMSSG